MCAVGAKAGDRFLIMGVDPPQDLVVDAAADVGACAWTTCSASGRCRRPPERLAFFQDFLEDQEDVLARDAYDEFAKAPYKDVQAVQGPMKHDQIVAWIKTPEIPASRRRLYLVMLSVCGGPADLPLLEDLLRSDDRKVKVGLDAMIGCYLMLAGSDGMPLIEELYLKKRQSRLRGHVRRDHGPPIHRDGDRRRPTGSGCCRDCVTSWIGRRWRTW